MGRFSRFLGLSSANKRLVAEAFFFVTSVRVALWIIPFRYVQRRLDFDAEIDPSSAVDWHVVEYTAAAVRAVSQYVPYASCLTQAISTSLLLKRRGQPSLIRIGVDLEKVPEFEAHAWVEVGDRIVIGRLPGHKRRFSILSRNGYSSL